VISVMVRVPKDLSGASLLGVHNWVKGNIARSNPGGSPDYTISDAKGDRLTLSDVARSAGSDINIEVTTVSGARSNPPANLTMIPSTDIPYPDMVRTGNNLSDLLPGEIDSALATRIVAEQGLHRGLHLLNRLTLSTYSKQISSPTTAALLQMGEIVKNNPSSGIRRNSSDRTPFTQRTPLQYGSEKALQQWLVETSGADKKEISVANTEVENAKIHAKYGLNTQDITKFAQEVLSDYLFAASANRGLLRTLIRNVPSLKANKQTIQKLAYMFPQQPSAFYEGRQRVFVAKPLFIYPAYSESLLTRKEMNSIVSFAEGYPANMGRSDSIPRALKSLTAFQRISPLQDLRAFLTLGARARDSSRWLEHRYTTQGHLSAVLSALTADPRQELSHRGFRPLCYYSDLGGFYPSPPPRWPRKLMYAIMDGFLENLPHIINMDDPTNSNLTPVQMAYFQKPAALTDKLVVDKLGGGTFKITVKQATEIAEMTAGYSEPPTREQITSFLNDSRVKKLYNNANIVKMEDSPAPENIQQILGNIEKATENKDQGLSPTATSQLTFDAAGPKSLLEMTYDIAEIATSKYDYNMRGDDFKFVMAVVTYSFRALTEATQGSAFEITRNRIEAGIEDIMGTNKFNRLERLRQSIAQNEFDERPRAGYIQSTLLAQLMVIDGEMTNRMNTVMTDETRERTRRELREEYNRITEALEEAPRSPSFTSAVQRILLNMNRTIQGA